MECKPCLSKGMKQALKNMVDVELHQMIDEVATCETGIVMELCPAGVVIGGKRGKKREKGERKRSAYQEFISQCMKEKPIKGKPFGAASKYMKECAGEWKHRNVPGATGRSQS